MSAGFPGTFNSNASETTGVLNIGAVQKQRSSSTAGYPGAFNSNGSETTGYITIGAVEKTESGGGGGGTVHNLLLLGVG